MAFQILVHYRNNPVTYNVSKQEDNVYHLRLQENGEQNASQKNEDYIPRKIVIRKKGKIWISDMDNYDELIDKLTAEITSFSVHE